MRIIIANDIDDSLWTRTEGRAWAQRALWLARQGDIVVLPCAPDERFLEHVQSVRGKIPEIHILPVPPGRNGSRILDPQMMLMPSFLREVRSIVADSAIEFEPLFPSARLIPFYDAVAPSRRVEEDNFLILGGANFANSKAFFHHVARLSDAPTPDAAVAFSAEEAVIQAEKLMEDGSPVVVKRAHAGGGLGNELLATVERELTSLGLPTQKVLNGSRTSLGRYFEERWAWASNDGHYPVVIERFIEATANGYVEYDIEDAHPRCSGGGTLFYEDSRISLEVIGRLPESLASPSEVVESAGRLARSMHKFGYRGNACFDFVVDHQGNFRFTECNARSTSGSHLKRLSNPLHIGTEPLLQHSASPDWGWISTGDILQAFEKEGLAFSHSAGTGVFLVIPASPNPRAAGFLYASIGVPESRLCALRKRLGDLNAVSKNNDSASR